MADGCSSALQKGLKEVDHGVWLVDGHPFSYVYVPSNNHLFRGAGIGCIGFFV